MPAPDADGVALPTPNVVDVLLVSVCVASVPTIVVVDAGTVTV
jgi:hypothetical protein